MRHDNKEDASTGYRVSAAGINLLLAVLPVYAVLSIEDPALKALAIITAPIVIPNIFTFFPESIGKRFMALYLKKANDGELEKRDRLIRSLPSILFYYAIIVSNAYPSKITAVGSLIVYSILGANFLFKLLYPFNVTLIDYLIGTKVVRYKTTLN